MNASPVTTWEGATAYFTFADQPVIIGIVLLGAIAACVYGIASMVMHENASYRKLGE